MGKKISEETRKKMILSQTGRKHSKESILKMSLIGKEKFKYFNPFSKPVYQIDKKTNEIIKQWESGAEAYRILNIKHISCVCIGKRKTAGGFKWKFA